MRGPTGRRALGPALLVAGVALVGGCSDPEAPGRVARSTTAPTSSTATPTPSPTTPEQQVEAAVRTYYSELNRTVRTNDPSRLQTLVDRSCPCFNVIKIAQRNASKGQTTPDARFDLKAVRVHNVDKTTAGAEVRYDVTAYRVMNSQGETVTSVPAQSSHFDLLLTRSANGWIVTNMINLEG